jgi:peptidoglycan L-alanyl-D-glutamate endopeptidase CwlK
VSFSFSARSLSKLDGVHPHLASVAFRAIKLSTVDFAVTEGLRTRERQAQLLAAGATRTMDSRHITGHAIDVAAFVGREMRWDWPLFARIAEAFEEASRRRGVPIVWGGSWRSFRDGPHFELPRDEYP